MMQLFFYGSEKSEMKDQMNNHTNEILKLIFLYHNCIENKYTETFNKILKSDYYLIHITGYSQPKNEWLDVMKKRIFNYHGIDINDLSLSVSPDMKQATATGDGIFNATIYGMKRPWHLRFKIYLSRTDDRWVIEHAEYSV